MFEFPAALEGKAHGLKIRVECGKETRQKLSGTNTAHVPELVHVLCRRQGVRAAEQML